MQQKNHTWIIVGLMVIIALGGMSYAWQQGWFNKVAPASLQSVQVEVPEEKSDLAQTALITPEEGGVIRAVDPLGVAFVLRVPPQAVSEEVEVTVTPFMPKVDGVNYGVTIEPTDLVFTKPVTLGVNWYLAGKLGHQNPYQAAPFAVALHDDAVDFVPLDKAAVTKNYVPVLVDGGGKYGISDDRELARQAATYTFNESEDRSARLYAGLSLARQGALGRSDRAVLEKDMAAVKAEAEPPVRDVYTTLLLEEKLGALTLGIPRAQAYGLIDGYLRFRCNLKESTYEDVLTAMIIAAHTGETEVEQLCKERAEELLLERANQVDRDTNRPLIDAVEVLQQMQLLGLDEGAGAAVAQRLSDDVTASLDAYLRSRGQEPLNGNTEGRVRANRPSDDPLIKGNSTLMLEMLGVSMLPLIGMDGFDEQNLKEFGARTRGYMGAMTELSRAVCDLSDHLGINMSQGGYSTQRQCQKVRSSMMERGLDQWKQEVDEMAEGIGDVQNDQTPNSNWSDTSALDPFIRFLEQ